MSRFCTTCGFGPESWRPVPGHEEYEVSSLARVRRSTGGKGTRAGRPRKLHKNVQTGYPCVDLYRNNQRTKYAVHQLVAMAFLDDRPDSADRVLHEDDDRDHCCASNLRWGDQAENMSDRRANGNGSLGANNPMSKLTRMDVLELRDLEGKCTQQEAADRFGICRQSVGDIWNRRRWQHL